MGLGNNGGSSTLVKSANTLKELGNEVFLIDSGSSKYTWSKLNCGHLVIKSGKTTIPEADFIISTGYKSVTYTLSAPKLSGIKCHWIRGWETWQLPEEKIVSSILAAPTIKFVNGLCLQERLKKYNCDSYLVRPGYDLNDYFPMNIRSDSKIILGGLYTKGKHEHTKRPDWILNVFNTLRKKYNFLDLWMYGPIDGPAGIGFYSKSPSMAEKNFLYNNVHLWLAPASLEGLHMPPAEAMLTECPVVGTNAEMSGMKDYLIQGITGIVTENNFDRFISGCELLIKNEFLRNEMAPQSRKRILKIGSREKNMKNFVKLLETIK